MINSTSHITKISLKYGHQRLLSWRRTVNLPWGSCYAWCRTAGVRWCSPCCGRPAAAWSSGTSAWLAPSGQRWLEPPPGGPSPLWGVWETRWPHPCGDAWCVWRPLLPPPLTCSTATEHSFNMPTHYGKWVKMVKEAGVKSWKLPNKGCWLWPKEVHKRQWSQTTCKSVCSVAGS